MSKKYKRLYEELITLRENSWVEQDYRDFFLDTAIWDTYEDIEDFKEWHNDYVWHTYDIESIEESLEVEREYTNE